MMIQRKILLSLTSQCDGPFFEVAEMKRVLGVVDFPLDLCNDVKRPPKRDERVRTYVYWLDVSLFAR